MKKLIVLMMAVCLSCSAMAKGKGVSCAKTQWLNGTKCVNCPANATCDGKTVKCQGKSFKLVGNKCVCSGVTLIKKGGSAKEYHCNACPVHGICDGNGNMKCGNGYILGRDENWTYLTYKCNKYNGNGVSPTWTNSGTVSCPGGYHRTAIKEGFYLYEIMVLL